MSVTVIPTPAGVSWIELRCRLGVLVADGADADRHPDAHAVTGKVRLTVNTPGNRIKWQEADGGWRSLDLPGIEYDVNAEGRLVSPDGTVGVFVPDPLSTNLDPREYTITAMVRPTGGASWTVTIGGALAMTSPVDLVHYSTVTPSPGVSSLEARVAALEASAGTGSGVEEVSGTVVLDASGPRLRQFYTVGAATIGGEVFAVDTALVARRTAAGTWQIAAVADDVWTGATGTVTPTAPTFADASGTASDTYTIPTKAGVDYRISGSIVAAGTYAGTGTVVISATPATGYTLAGTTSWSYTFSEDVVQTWNTTLASANFDTADRTIYYNPADATNYPGYIDQAGKRWAGASLAAKIASNKLFIEGTTATTSVDLARSSGDYSLRADVQVPASVTVICTGRAPSIGVEGASQFVALTPTLISLGGNTPATMTVGTIGYVAHNKTAGTTVALRVDLVGSTISVYLDGLLYLKGTYGPAQITATTGPYSWFKSGTWDNVEILAP